MYILNVKTLIKPDYVLKIVTIELSFIRLNLSLPTQKLFFYKKFAIYVDFGVGIYKCWWNNFKNDYKLFTLMEVYGSI